LVKVSALTAAILSRNQSNCSSAIFTRILFITLITKSLHLTKLTLVSISTATKTPNS